MAGAFEAVVLDTEIPTINLVSAAVDALQDSGRPSGLSASSSCQPDRQMSGNRMVEMKGRKRVWQQ